jgi:hypothetical protein
MGSSGGGGGIKGCGGPCFASDATEVNKSIESIFKVSLVIISKCIKF